MKTRKGAKAARCAVPERHAEPKATGSDAIGTVHSDRHLGAPWPGGGGRGGPPNRSRSLGTEWPPKKNQTEGRSIRQDNGVFGDEL